jgi:hypothetical protein
VLRRNAALARCAAAQLELPRTAFPAGPQSCNLVKPHPKPKRCRAIALHAGKPLHKPAASPIPVIRRNVLRTGTTDHQLADLGSAALNDLVMTTSRASGYRREKTLIHQGPYRESRNRIAGTDAVYPTVATHRLLKVPAVEHARSPVLALLIRNQNRQGHGEQDEQGPHGRLKHSPGLQASFCGLFACCEPESSDTAKHPTLNKSGDNQTPYQVEAYIERSPEGGLEPPRPIRQLRPSQCNHGQDQGRAKSKPESGREQHRRNEHALPTGCRKNPEQSKAENATNHQQRYQREQAEIPFGKIAEVSGPPPQPLLILENQQAPAHPPENRPGHRRRQRGHETTAPVTGFPTHGRKLANQLGHSNQSREPSPAMKNPQRVISPGIRHGTPPALSTA